MIKVYLQPTADNKPYPMLDEAVLKAIVEEAHAHGVMVRAHVTQLSLAPMALDAGVDRFLSKGCRVEELLEAILDR